VVGAGQACRWATSFQWSGSFAGDVVTEKVYLWYTEDTFARIDENLMCLELSEECSKVLLVFFWWFGEDKDVIQICETEVKVSKDVVHETLKCLSSVPKSK
jgi:hypothetical protein